MMSWFSDTFKALLGFDEEERAYRDSLASAERHVHWGCTQRDAKDLRQALTLLRDCPPEEAPNAHYAYRCVRAAAEAHAHLALLAAQQVQDKDRKLREHFESVEDSRKSLLAQIKALQRRVQELENEGSLISAREERRRLEDMEREAHELPNVAEERENKIKEVMSQSVPQFTSHRENAGECVTALKAISGLAAGDADIRDTITGEIEKNLAQLDERWKKVSAEMEAYRRSATSPSPSPPPPPVQTPDQEQPKSEEGNNA
jgi:predicted RNase H-like nuclease (RuvC/YqgF family)